ncbi:hypothetical protein K438DRAFT_1763205 [Mycena galopus ATCC 62051]|nr:hypothetical protein K438DRAFT_1763205 [Mycena galopus ATCC 62051]
MYRHEIASKILGVEFSLPHTWCWVAQERESATKNRSGAGIPAKLGLRRRNPAPKTTWARDSAENGAQARESCAQSTSEERESAQTRDSGSKPKWGRFTSFYITYVSNRFQRLIPG